MQREVIRKVTNILPDAIKEVSKYIKTNFNATGQKALLNAGWNSWISDKAVWSFID
jgi:hypothetical protein